MTGLWLTVLVNTSLMEEEVVEHWLKPKAACLQSLCSSPLFQHLGACYTLKEDFSTGYFQLEKCFSCCAEMWLLVSNPPLHHQHIYTSALVLSFGATRDKPAPAPAGFRHGIPVPLNLSFSSYRMDTQLHTSASYKTFSRLSIAWSLHIKIICLCFLKSLYEISCSFSNFKSPTVRMWSFMSNLNITSCNLQFSLVYPQRGH